MKLELKHLAPYLPYGLPIEPIYKSTFMGGYNQRILDTSILDNYELEEIKPILRPLSDLTKEIEFNGEKFTPLCILTKQQFDKDNESVFDDENLYLIEDDKYCYPSNGDKTSYYWLSYNERMQRFDSCDTTDLNQLNLLNTLLEWHFDVFGLIEQGLAIDINTL